MKLRTGKKFRQKLSKKTKQLFGKMIPVEGNVFQTISYNRPEDETSGSGNDEKQTRKSLKESLKKRMSAMLRLKTVGDGNMSSDIRSAWHENTENTRNNSQDTSSSTSPDHELDYHNNHDMKVYETKKISQ